MTLDVGGRRGVRDMVSQDPIEPSLMQISVVVADSLEIWKRSKWRRVPKIQHMASG